MNKGFFKKREKRTNKRFWASKLGIQIIASTLIAMTISAGVFFMLGIAEKHIFIDDKLRSREYIEENTKKEVEILQKYVDENNLSIRDLKKVIQWVHNKRNVMLKIYDGNRIIYDSSLMDFNAEPEAEPEYDEEFEKKKENRILYDLKFADKDTKIEMFCFFSYRRVVYFNYLNLGISFITFIFILMSLIKEQTSYITQLEEDIKILEGGDLDYKITVRGNNELTYLAKSLDDMRISFIDRLEEEEKARYANHKLVTAMSHDLRTPLTVLIGLLEILSGKKYTSKDEMDYYIKKSCDKAYQIKSLSDQLFEYFLAFNINDEDISLQEYGGEVINEINEDYIFSLEEKGYKLDYKPVTQEVYINVDISYIHRVFDNVFSNLLKYADKNEVIKIYNKIDNDFISIYFENHINKDIDKVESTNIGLETCKNIMQRHNGEFFTETEGECFKAVIRLRREK